MHILADNEPARDCAVCKKRTTRRLYGSNNTPICVLCRMTVVRKAAPDYQLDIKAKAAQEIDDWEPKVLP